MLCTRALWWNGVIHDNRHDASANPFPPDLPDAGKAQIIKHEADEKSGISSPDWQLVADCSFIAC
jgi:hypothetical protein